MIARNPLADCLSISLSGLMLAFAMDSSALAQGSGSSRLGQPGSGQPTPAPRQPAPAYRQPYSTPAQPAPGVARPPSPEEFAQNLWRFLIRPQSPYVQWPPLRPEQAGFRKGESPHGDFLRSYANPVAVGDPANLPPGSILVLEDYATDQKTRTGINILYRVKGYDPANGDWYWMKYNQNGTVVRTAPEEGSKPVAGRVMTCIECHRKAGGNDLVYSNDPPVEKAEKGAGAK
jgi:hypothetical protein